MKDVAERLPFILTSEQLPQYDLTYAGRQHVDELDTYVFDLEPKRLEKGQRYFRGRVWVDDKDLQIVKTAKSWSAAVWSKALRSSIKDSLVSAQQTAQCRNSCIAETSL